MEFVVIGGAGFIGSHLVRRLVADGHRVTVVDNLVRGKMANLEDILKDVRFVEMDMCDHDSLDGTLHGADGIFHQAALGSVPESWKDPDTYKMVNVGGTWNVFRIAAKHNIKVVYASSSSVYGHVQKIPIPEDVQRRPLNPYGQTKLDCEVLAEKYSSSGSEIVGLRYFNVYGVGQNPNYAGVITRFLERMDAGEPPVIFGDGRQIRDFTFVDDVVDANVLAMSSNVKSGFFNIGGGRSTSVGSLARMMADISGINLEPQYESPRPGDPRESTADISKAAAELGWNPRTRLEDGLRILLQSRLKRSS